jgi:hypothetical protein
LLIAPKRPLDTIGGMRALFLLFWVTSGLFAQSPGVPVYAEGRGSGTMAGLLKQAEALKTAGRLLPMKDAETQFDRSSCELALPPAGSTPLPARDRWKLSRLAHIRVGHFYLCTKCEKWHLDLSGGYAITADGAVGTCAHVLPAPEGMREGYLVAATDDDEVLPVTEVLAVSSGTDCAIIRVKTAQPLTPLPLATDVTPGDEVWCFSDPSGKRGYYSEGIVSRFVKRTFLRKKETKGLPAGTVIPKPVWLETTLDWAPGSSGSAIVDAHGNCVGHVSEIQPVLEDPPPAAAAKKRAAAFTPGTYIVFHQAITAGELLKLIRPKP